MIPMLDASSLTVLITGASSGFGAATARRFHEAGARVIGTGRRRERLDALKAELGDRCAVLELDVTDTAAVASTLRSLPAGFDRPNVCVANAGLALGRNPAHLSKFEDWERMIATNVSGLAATVHAVLPGMVERDEGHIVLLGSVAGDYANPGSNIYGATKAFVKQLALNLRADLLGKNVRVTNIEPGLAETEFALVRFEGDRQKAAQPYEGIQSMSAEDIAETIFWSCVLPRHLNINRMQMMPVMQGFGPLATHKKS